MEYRFLGNSKLRVSRVGIGGHYKAMEEGRYEDRYAYVEREVAARAEIFALAIQAGVNYIDTTWRNEVAMVAEILRQLNARDQFVVNGMVLGAFTGSKAAGQSVEDYFNRWLDERLTVIPDHRFDVFMINALEEGYNDAECERLLKVLQTRRAAGDFRVMGFSCHNAKVARTAADRFPEFEVIMLPYNFHNRAFEKAFDGYSGSADFIAMKSLVWLEYGIPFCAINALPNFEQNFHFAAAPDASARAQRFVCADPRIRTVIGAVNSPAELDLLVQAGEGAFGPADQQTLAHYQSAAAQDQSVPLYLGGLRHDNLRMNYFGAMHLSRVLGVQMPDIPLNLPDSPALVRAYAASLMPLVQAQGLGHYL